MKEKQNPLVFTLIVWLIWLLITLGGQKLQAGGTISLDDLATSSIIYSVIAAIIFLLIVIAYKKWWQEVGLNSSFNSHNWRLLLLPVIVILIMLTMAFTSGVATNVLLIVLINSLFVGISEELMMRGVLFHGVSFSQSIVRTVIITAVLFGAMHALNGFLTGEFGPAMIQAVMAAGFGVWVAALRVRLNSVIPVMILHGLWDFSVFSMGAGSVAIGQLLVFGFAVILFIYGLWLLRGIKPQETAAAIES